MHNFDARFVAGLVVALGLFSSAPALGDGGDILWQEQFDHAGGEDAVSGMGLRGQKVLIVGGVAPSAPAGVNDTWIVRAYDVKDSGSEEWSDTFVNPDGGEMVLASLSVSGNRVLAVGSRETASGKHHYFVRCYDARKGTIYWEDEVDTGADEGRARATFLKGKSGWVVGSRTSDATGLTQWWIRTYNVKDGSLLWEDIPAGTTTDATGASSLYVQGSTLLVGGVGEGGAGTDWRMRGYRTKDGTLLWEDTWDSGFGDDVISGIKGMGKRSVFGGTVSAAVGTDMRIIGIETKTGTPIWEEFIDEGTDETAAGVMGHGPCVFMGGTVDDDFYIKGFATYTGFNMWDDRVDSGGFDATNAMGNYGSKTVFAAGVKDAAGGTGSGNLFIRNYSFHTGEIVWEVDDDVDGDDAVTGIFAKGNNVFTIGHADQGGDQDWVVTNYDRQ